MTANWVNNTTLRLIAYGENAPTLDIPIKLSIISVAIKFADDSSMLVFKDMVVSKSSWKSDSTYTTEGFGYSADIVCPNVTEEYMPEVTFNVTDAACGNFSSNAATFDGIVRIYAREIPNEDIAVPTIICTIAAARLIGGSHAETHAKGGVDPITPEMIGAAKLGTDGKVLPEQLPEMQTLSKTIIKSVPVKLTRDSYAGTGVVDIATINIDILYEYIGLIIDINGTVSHVDNYSGTHYIKFGDSTLLAIASGSRTDTFENCKIFVPLIGNNGSEYKITHAGVASSGNSVTIDLILDIYGLK